MAPPPTVAKSRAKSLVVFVLKAAVAAALIGWLLRKGALDLGALREVFERPELLAVNMGVFFLAAAFGAMRWRTLLGVAGVHLPVARAMQLHFVALFFNVVIPGNVGGDVVKALYVARDAPPEKRTTILLIVFIERLMGLGGLVTVATIIMLARGDLVWRSPLLRPLGGTVALLAVGTVVGPALLVLLMRRMGDRIEAWTSGTTAIARILGRLVAAMRLLSASPRGLVTAMAFSMGIHVLSMSLFTLFTRTIGHYDASLAQTATIFPLGVLTMVIPISPAGLGVGHVAFDRLFTAIGLTGGATGATVFNVYLLGQIVPCLLGVIPYVALKRQAPVPTLEEETPEKPS